MGDIKQKKTKRSTQQNLGKEKVRNKKFTGSYTKVNPELIRWWLSKTEIVSDLLLWQPTNINQLLQDVGVTDQ